MKTRSRDLSAFISFTLFVFMLLSIVLFFTSPLMAGTLTGQITDDTGEAMENISVMVFQGNDPDRLNAPPEELKQAIMGRTDNSGNFSIIIPDNIDKFNFKVRLNSTFYSPIIINDISNKTGSFNLGGPMIANFPRDETFWVTSDTNSDIPGTNSIDTNRWEQLKVRGKLMPIVFPKTIIESLKSEPVEEQHPVIRGLPQKQVK